MNLKPGYDHLPEFVESNRQGVADRFAGHPEMAAELLRFIEE